MQPYEARNVHRGLKIVCLRPHSSKYSLGLQPSQISSTKMPGRKSTGPPSLQKSKNPKHKAKRSQNALAIAEQQAPIRTKIRQNRLGESEPEPPKRKRQGNEEDSELEDSKGNAKRRKFGEKDRYGNEIERGSDSSGNEWTVGQVDEEDDSDIDSDEAMADSDNEGAAIKGSVAHSAKVQLSSRSTGPDVVDDVLQDIDLREDEDEDGDGALEDGSDSFGDEGVDLAAVLDESDDGEGLPEVSKNLEHTEGESSEEGSDEDLGTKPTSEDEESTLSFSGDEDDAGDSAKLASLQALVSTMNEQDQTSTRPRAPPDAQESMTPSEFGLTSKRKLTVADLVPSITDPKLRRSLKLLADNDTKSSSKRGGIPKKLDVPLPKRQQDRLDRAAAYEKSKETLNRWIDTVKHNRRAEHLSFPLKDPNAVAAQSSTRLLPTSHSKPLTDLESTIQNILEDSGLTGSKGNSEEDKLQAFEELKTNKMPLEEVQARRAELRRARELLFREEIRAKRIKKIKSKTYRKIHRKERERNAQQEKAALTAAGVDDSESEQERNDRRRAEERMGARHRESKWAKGVKESGRAKWDEDARGGVTEMARRGEELRRRMEGKTVVGDDDSEPSSESEEYDDVDDVINRDERLKNKHRERLQRLDEDGAKGSRLASMDFMKNAENARKIRNEADLENLRRDLAGEETPSEDDSEGPGRRIFGPAKGKPVSSRAPRKEAKSEFEERQDSDLEGGDDPEKPEDEELEIIVDASSSSIKANPVNKSSISDRHKTTLQTSKEPLTEASDNPWLMPSKKDSNRSKKRLQESDAAPIILNALTAEVDVPSSSKPAPRSALKGARKAEQGRQSAHTSTKQPAAEASDGEEDDESAERLPFVLRNQDLVRKAFAGDEVVADFEAEKLATMESEEEKIIDNTLPGWGSWTGAGVGKKQQNRNRNKNLTKQPGIAKEKRQDAKLDRVIINERRVKKNGKYLASSLPHPFETRQQYQRSLRMPVGPEFATKLAFQDATKPRILMKQGIITPMAKPII